MGSKSQVSSPKYDMDAYMATLFEGLGLVLQVESSRTLDLILNTSSPKKIH
jgi:hypothetical protein